MSMKQIGSEVLRKVIGGTLGSAASGIEIKSKENAGPWNEHEVENNPHLTRPPAANSSKRREIPRRYVAIEGSMIVNDRVVA
jgi:hypothetical protein